MLELESLSVHNHIVWSDARFPFEPGVSYVRGKNRSGKSVLFRAMRLAIFGAGGGKRHNDSAKVPAKSTVALDFKADGKSWNIVATAKKVDIIEDGSSLELSGKKSGLSKLASLMPPELFDSTVYLSGRDKHRLQLSSPIETADWLSSLFRIDEVYDRLLAKAKTDLAAANKAKIQLGVVQQTLREARQAFGAGKSKADPAARKGLIDRLTTKRDKLSEALAKARADTQRHVEVLPVLLQRDELPELGKPPAGDKESIKAAIDKLERTERGLVAYRSAEDAQSATLKAKRRLKNDLATLQREMQELETRFGCDPSVAGSALEELADALDAQVEAWREQAEVRRKVGLLAKKALSVKAAKTRLLAASDERQRAGAAVSLLTAKLAELGNRLQGGDCPACGQQVSAKHLATERKTLTERLAKAKRREATMNTSVERLTACAAWSQRRDPSLALAAVKRAGRVFERYQELRLRADKLSDAISGLPSTKLPPRPTFKGSLGDLRAKITEQRNRLEGIDSYDRLAQRHQDVRAAMKRLQIREDTPTKTVREARDAGTARIQHLEAEVLGLTTKVATLTEADRSLGAAEGQEAALEPLAGRVGPLAALVEAFGRTGLRLHRLETVASAFEAALNEAVPMIWPADFRFSVQPSNKGISMRLYRGAAGESDLSTLSGSEEQAWKVLCAYALARILPPDLRCDAIVLDEIESNMDEPSRELLAKHFMPVLREAFPKIVIVSPQDRAHLPAAIDHAYEVIRTKAGKSNLRRV